jgi:dienelactone hydrolase
VGFCWGGLLAWRAACSLKGLSAAACYYGGGMTTADEVARQPQVPVLAHFGQHDHWISVDSVQAFARAHPDVQVHVYDADHGFNCDQRGSRMTKPRPWWRATAPWPSLQSTWGRAAFSGWPGHRRGVCVARGSARCGGPSAPGHCPPVRAR